MPNKQFEKSLALATGQWRRQPNIGRTNMLEFRQITLRCLERRFSRHKMTIFSKNLGEMHGHSRSHWLRLCYCCC